MPLTDAKTCQHKNFRANVEVARITESDDPNAKPKRYSADVRVWCEECGLPFRFLGLPAGVDLSGAATSIDAQEARLAIAPQGEVAACIDGAPLGFSVKKVK